MKYKQLWYNLNSFFLLIPSSHPLRLLLWLQQRDDTGLITRQRKKGRKKEREWCDGSVALRCVCCWQAEVCRVCIDAESALLTWPQRLAPPANCPLRRAARSQTTSHYSTLAERWLLKDRQTGDSVCVCLHYCMHACI